MSVSEKKVTVMQDGKPVEKVHKLPKLTDYEWITFDEFGALINSFTAALLLDTETKKGTVHTATNGKSKSKQADKHVSNSDATKVAIFASTRPEWQVACQSCMSAGLVAVTAYPSLGPKALTFSLKQTEVSHIVTEAKLIDTVVKSVADLDKVKYIIYFDKVDAPKLAEYAKTLPHVKFMSYDDMIARGKNIKPEEVKKVASLRREVTPDCLAVIMYTSGSTNDPKG